MNSAVAVALLFAFALPAQSRPALEELTEVWPSGTRKARYAIDSDGRKTGQFQGWHENGKLSERAWYRAGVLEGLHETFHADGGLARRETVKGGIREGDCLERTADGAQEIRSKWQAGRQHGKCEVVEQGRLAWLQEWRAGMLVQIFDVVAHPKSAAEIERTLAGIGPPRPENTPEGALQVLQSYRYLCDLPYADLRLDADLNRHCAAAARLCAAIGKLDHTPENPGWPEAEYRFAFTGTSSSNLSVGTDLPGSVHSYMHDSDPTNIARVGHRRWCLNPAMLRTGFGASGGYAAMWSFDASRSKLPEYDAVVYPPRGLLPARYFGAGHAWSVSLNPNRFRAPDAAQAQIRVLGLDGRYLPQGAPLEVEAVSAVTGGPGIPYCLIFRPKGQQVAPGQRYWCEITLLKETKQERRTLRWLVEFF